MRSVSLQYNVYPAEVSGERLLLLVSQKVFVQHTGLDSGIVLVFAGLVFLIVAQDGVVIDLADLYVIMSLPRFFLISSPDSSMGVPPSLKFSWKCLYNNIRYLGGGREAVSRTASRRRG